MNNKANKMNLVNKKFNKLKKIANILPSDILGNKKRTIKISKIKTLYHILENNKNKKKESIDIIKLKKFNYQYNYNSNSLLNKWT